MGALKHQPLDNCLEVNASLSVDATHSSCGIVKEKQKSVVRRSPVFSKDGRMKETEGRRAV